MKESFFGDYGKCRRPSNYQKHFIVLFNTQTYSRNYDYNLTQSKQIANASIVDVESDMELVVVPQDQCVDLEDAKNQNLDQVIINFISHNFTYSIIKIYIYSLTFDTSKACKRFNKRCGNGSGICCAGLVCKLPNSTYGFGRCIKRRSKCFVFHDIELHDEVKFRYLNFKIHKDSSYISLSWIMSMLRQQRSQFEMQRRIKKIAL